MTKRLIKDVASGNMPPAAIDVPFSIVSESCMSPYISHDLHWEYWLQYGSYLAGQPPKEIPISEDTACRLIDIYGLKMHCETYDKRVFDMPINSNYTVRHS